MRGFYFPVFAVCSVSLAQPGTAAERQLQNRRVSIIFFHCLKLSAKFFSRNVLRGPAGTGSREREWEFLSFPGLYLQIRTFVRPLCCPPDSVRLNIPHNKMLSSEKCQSSPLNCIFVTNVLRLVILTADVAATVFTLVYVVTALNTSKSPYDL